MPDMAKLVVGGIDDVVCMEGFRQWLMQRSEVGQGGVERDKEATTCESGKCRSEKGKNMRSSFSIAAAGRDALSGWHASVERQGGARITSLFCSGPALY